MRLRNEDAIWLTALVWCGTGCSAPPRAIPIAPHVTPVTPDSTALPFCLDERLAYAASVCGLPAGRIEFELTVPAAPERLHADLRARTAGPAAFLFELDERIDAEIEAGSLKPRRARVHSRRRGDLHELMLYFEQAERLVISRYRHAGESVVRLHEVTDAWEPLSFLLHVRRTDWTATLADSFSVHVGAHIYSIDVRYSALERIDRGDVAAAAERLTLACRRAGAPGDREPPRLDLTAWIEAAAPRRLLRLATATPVGPLTIDLLGETP